MKKLLLLDGNSMLFRAYYATLYTHRMTTSNGSNQCGLWLCDDVEQGN